MKPEAWVVSSDTGLSSKTIWAVMMGVDSPRFASPPLDPSDFGRCYRMLFAVDNGTAWRARLDEVAARHPEWTPFVREWAALEALYLAELAEAAERGDPRIKMPRLYKLMGDLVAEGRRLVGRVPNAFEGRA